MMRRDQRSQRGAVLPIMAVMVSIVIGVGAFAVDLGMQRVARRDMQALADAIALDMARLVDGRTRQCVESPTAPGCPVTTKNSKAATLAGSLARNDDSTVGSAPVIHVYYVNAAADGTYPTSGGIPTEVLSSASPNAVVVTANTAVDFSLGRVFGVSQGEATRSALASTHSEACFDMGSYAARINTESAAILGGQLGSLSKLLHLSTNLSAVDYKALAGSSVTLAGLAAAPTIGTPNAVVGSTPVTVNDVISASIYALQHDPGASSTDSGTAISALNAIQHTLTLNGNTNVVLGDALKINSGDTSALATKMSVLELVGASIGIANGTNFLDTGVPINLPGVASTNVKVSVGEGVRRACGVPNMAPAINVKQSQVKLETSVTMPALSTLGLTTSVGPVVLGGGVGNGTASLVAPNNIVCGAGTLAAPDSYSVNAGGNLLGFGVSAPVTINGSLSVFNNASVPLPAGLLTNILNSLFGLLNSVVDVKVTFTNVGFNLAGGIPGSNASFTTKTVTIPTNAGDSTPVGTAVNYSSAPQILGTAALPTSVTGVIQIQAKTLLGGWGAPTNLNLSVANNLTLLQNILGPVLNTTVSGINTATSTLQNGLLKDVAALLGLDVGGVDVYGVTRPTCAAPRLIG